MKFLIVLFALCAVAFGTFVPKLDGRIVGGEKTTIEDYPYQASVRYMDQHICGGSIIDTHTIITAAHCVHEMDHTKYNIRVGATKHGNGKNYKVNTIIQHEKYNANVFDNDIAILKLGYSLDLSREVAPISLQDRNLEVSVGTTAYVTGWGVTQEGGQDIPDDLRMVDVSVITDSECASKYAGINEISKQMLCAQTTGHDSCQGDSGGPLAANGKLIGVVSWGYGCARPQYPGVYAKVSSLYEWIMYHK